MTKGNPDYMNNIEAQVKAFIEERGPSISEAGAFDLLDNAGPQNDQTIHYYYGRERLLCGLDVNGPYPAEVRYSEITCPECLYIMRSVTESVVGVLFREGEII